MVLTVVQHLVVPVSEHSVTCRATQSPILEQPVAVTLPEASMPDPTDPLTLDLGAAVVQSLP